MQQEAHWEGEGGRSEEEEEAGDLPHREDEEAHLDSPWGHREDEEAHPWGELEGVPQLLLQQGLGQVQGPAQRLGLVLLRHQPRRAEEQEQGKREGPMGEGEAQGCLQSSLGPPRQLSRP